MTFFWVEGNKCKGFTTAQFTTFEQVAQQHDYEDGKVHPALPTQNSPDRWKEILIRENIVKSEGGLQIDVDVLLRELRDDELESRLNEREIHRQIFHPVSGPPR